MTERHAPGQPRQLRYPGGKDGMWEVGCLACDYSTGPYDSAGAALMSLWRHAYAKNNEGATPYLTREQEMRLRAAARSGWHQEGVPVPRLSDLRCVLDELDRLRRELGIPYSPP